MKQSFKDTFFIHLSQKALTPYKEVIQIYFQKYFIGWYITFHY